MKKEMVVVFAIACLLFGCFGSGNGGTTPTPYNGGSTPTPYNGGGGGGATTPTPAPTQGGNGAGGLAGLGWDALIALGTPVQCTVRSGDQTWDMKMRGDNFRAESDVASDGQTTHVLMIGKDNFVYMQMGAEMQQMPGASDCAWLKMEQGPAGEPATGQPETTDYNSLPPENMTCSPALFGDDVFATSGRACTMDDLMPPTPPPGGDGDACSACASISDPDARAMCLQYCGG